MILSLVRSKPEYEIERAPSIGWCKRNMGFIIDHHQMNVALTRARLGLIIIGEYSTTFTTFYASSALCGFTNATDRQKITAFILHRISTAFCALDVADFYEFYIRLMCTCLRKSYPVQTTSYGSSYHHLLYGITILQLDGCIEWNAHN